MWAQLVVLGLWSHNNALVLGQDLVCLSCLPCQHEAGCFLHECLLAHSRHHISLEGESGYLVAEVTLQSVCRCQVTPRQFQSQLGLPGDCP